MHLNGSPAAAGFRPDPVDGRPLLSLSLDLDNQWSYMKIHGSPGWETMPSYLEAFTGLALERLAHHGLTITVFVVGQDAALPEHRDCLGRIAAAGHEIGNHSFRHEPWLHRYSRGELERELAQAEEAIEAVTGRRTRGFRGPGFSMSRSTLEVLMERGYLYDASTFPTFLGPVARSYYFWKSRGLGAQEKEERKRLFGTLSDGLRPLKPYRWQGDGRTIAEIPVTTIPGLRMPFHLSYLLYLAGHSRSLCRLYLRLAVTACRLTGTEPSFLLHPPDFLGRDRVQGLEFFPGMNLDTDFKLELFDEVIVYIKRHFRIVTLEEHASRIAAGPARALPAAA